MERLFVIKSHISPLILVLPSPHACVIQINRPSARNAFNFEIIENVIRHVSMARSAGKPVVITGIPKRFFGSGGDLKLVTSKILKIPEFLRSLHHMFYLVSLVKNSVSLWTGHVIGSGAGLACSCKVRVAFPSTLYSMPENMLGLFPDVGASYFLTHYVQEKSIGLYISLTGVVLDGYDCYVLGLCNYFIEEEDYEKVLSGNAEVLEKNHKEIEKGMRYLEKSKVWKKKKIIEECFGNCQSVNEVFERLLRNNTQWARDVLELLKQACPLSLKVK